MTTSTIDMSVRSVFLECRQWRDKTAGETYTSAALWVNGRVIAYFGLQYGALEVMEDTVARYMEKAGLLPDSDNYRALARRLRALGVDYYTAREWRIKAECWPSSENLSPEELWEELSRDYTRAVAL